MIEWHIPPKPFRVRVVRLIKAGETQEALDLLSDHFKVPEVHLIPPRGALSRKVESGLVSTEVGRWILDFGKASGKLLGGYLPRSTFWRLPMIIVLPGYENDPRVILHEFYHHVAMYTKAGHRVEEGILEAITGRFLEGLEVT